jgi:hypothetical protein
VTATADSMAREPRSELGFASLRTATLLGLLLVAWLLLYASPASASSTPSVTLSGHVDGNNDPDTSGVREANVEATLTAAGVEGVLSTEGREPANQGLGPFYTFAGKVTCMIVSGNRVTVGALGEAVEHGKRSEGFPEKHLGSYANILTVEYGPVGSPAAPHFGMLGTFNQGVPSSKPPDCKTASFAELHPATSNGPWLSPEITSLLDGASVTGDSVTLSGIAQAHTSIAVYEPGRASSGTVVSVGDSGVWSVTLSDLAPGTHLFTASALGGNSLVPSNTVQVTVVAPAPPPPPTGPGSTSPLANTPVAPIPWRGPPVTAVPASGVGSAFIFRAGPLSLSHGYVAVSLASDVNGTGSIAGYLTAGGSHHVLRLGARTVSLKQGGHRRVRLGLAAAAVGELRAAMARHRAVIAHFTLTIHTVTGETVTVRRSATFL